MDRALLGAAGIGIALFGGTFLVYFISMLASGGDGKTRPGVYMGLIVMFAGLLAIGLYLAWRSFIARPPTSGQSRPGAGPARGSSRSDRANPGQPPATPRPATDADREQLILHLAEREGGRLTVVEAATHADLTVADAKAVLDRLVLQQAAQIQVTTAGVLVYVFPGFLSDDEKAGATDF
ncbi:MAG: hypothetical protein U0893_18160 [Chloroflexota bacterium]